jgi:hypothetical protein
MRNSVRDRGIEASGNRRAFVRNIGLAAAVGAFATTKGQAQSPPPITDVDILNFALNLEYLEAEFYVAATTGKLLSNNSSIVITGSGASGATTGGKQVAFTDSVTQAVAQELAANELTHVTLLQNAIKGLGGTPIAKPAIKLDALGFGFNNQTEFLTLARIFEDIGVTAYGGAAPQLKNYAIIGTAARILAVEAEHAGNIRLMIARNAITTTALDSVDHLPPPSGGQYFSTNSSALTEVRSPGQVLFLAYGGAANATSGGFFPAGVNGTINTASGTADQGEAAILSASPNPILVSGGGLGSTVLTFNAPGVAQTQLRIGGPGGSLVANLGSNGTIAVGGLTDGAVLYLQNSSAGNALSPLNTLGTVTIHVTQQ